MSMNIKVILQEKLDNLGNFGDQVFVRPGYARNFLFPYGKAVLATPENITRLEQHRTALEKLSAEQLEKIRARAKQLEGKTFYITAKAGNEGKLFGSVGSREIAEAISSKDVSISKREVSLPKGPIRQIGEYEIPVHLHTQVVTTLKIKVVSK